MLGNPKLRLNHTYIRAYIYDAILDAAGHTGAESLGVPKTSSPNRRDFG
jgi:hypothetical protein